MGNDDKRLRAVGIGPMFGSLLLLVVTSSMVLSPDVREAGSPIQAVVVALRDVGIMVGVFALVYVLGGLGHLAVFRKFESFASSESGRLLLVGPAGVGLVKTLESAGYYRGSGSHGAYGLVLTQGSVRIVAGMGDFEEIARIPTESIKACRPAMVTTRTRRIGGIELDLEGFSGSAKIALGATGTGPFRLWAQKLRELKAIAATLESAAVQGYSNLDPAYPVTMVESREPEEKGLSKPERTARVTAARVRADDHPEVR